MSNDVMSTLITKKMFFITRMYSINKDNHCFTFCIENLHSIALYRYEM